jgi:hypothetical protein
MNRQETSFASQLAKDDDAKLAGKNQPGLPTYYLSL